MRVVAAAIVMALVGCKHAADRRSAEATDVKVLGSEGESKTTESNAVFTKDVSNPKLGEAWRDPSGMIWGDIVPRQYGTFRRSNHSDATLTQNDAYLLCLDRQAELPFYRDYERLREYMGATRFFRLGDYKPQVLPNLTYLESGAAYGHKFWTGTDDSEYRTHAFYFDGRSGVLETSLKISDQQNVVRCVVRNDPAASSSMKLIPENLVIGGSGGGSGDGLMGGFFGVSLLEKLTGRSFATVAQEIEAEKDR